MRQTVVSFSVGLGPSDSQRPGGPISRTAPAAFLRRLPLRNACQEEEGGSLGEKGGREGRGGGGEKKEKGGGGGAASLVSVGFPLCQACVCYGKDLPVSQRYTCRQLHIHVQQYYYCMCGVYMILVRFTVGRDCQLAPPPPAGGGEWGG